MNGDSTVVWPTAALLGSMLQATHVCNDLPLVVAEQHPNLFRLAMPWLLLVGKG